MPGDASDTLIFAAEVFRIQGAVFEVYRSMGAYLRATGLKLGLLVNCGHAYKAQIVRLAL